MLLKKLAVMLVLIQYDVSNLIYWRVIGLGLWLPKVFSIHYDLYFLVHIEQVL